VSNDWFFASAQLDELPWQISSAKLFTTSRDTQERIINTKHVFVIDEHKFSVSTGPFREEFG